jgi:TolB protein
MAPLGVRRVRGQGAPARRGGAREDLSQPKVRIIHSQRYTDRSTLHKADVGDGKKSTARRALEVVRRMLGLAVLVVLVLAATASGRTVANGLLAFDLATGHGGIDVVRPDGSGLRDLVPAAPDAIDPVWSPDGRHIAYVRGGDSGFHTDVWVADADGTHQHRLTRFDTVSPTGIAWSSRGLIAFSALEGGLYKIPASGGTPTRVRAPLTASGPAFSPDGRQIAFAASPGGLSRIYVERTIGGQPRRLTTGRTKEQSPAWSPDGRRIAFTAAVGNGTDVLVVGVDGSGRRRVTRTRDAAAPGWSPDGRLLAYVEHGAVLGKGDIVVSRPDGSGRRRLTHGAHALSDLSWRRG